MARGRTGVGAGGGLRLREVLAAEHWKAWEKRYV